MVRLRRLLDTALILCVVEIAILTFHDAGHRGPDIAGYASYAQSLTFDGDVLLFNEFEEWHKPIFITPTGYASALGNIGVAYFWIPFLAAAYWILALLRAALPGVPMFSSVAIVGSDEYFFHALNFANELFAVIALTLCFCFARRYAARRGVLFALFFTTLASPFFYYATYYSPNASIPSALVAALFLFTWNRAREYQSAPLWFLLGSLTGVLFMLASYNVSLTCFALLSLAALLGKPGGGQKAVRYGIVFGLGGLIGAAPQLITWQILFGRLTNPYAENLDWLNPHLLEVLFSTFHGLYFYAPFLLLATGGIALLARKDRTLAVGTLATVVVHVYISSITIAWWAGGSFGMRFLLPLTPLFILGAAALFDAMPRVSVYALSCVCLLWTYLLFLGTYGQRIDPADFFTLSQQLENVETALRDFPNLAANHLLTIKSAATPLLLLPFTLVFILTVSFVRRHAQSNRFLSDQRFVISLGASPILLILLMLHAGEVGAAHLQAYQSRTEYVRYAKGNGDPADVSYTLSERARYELRTTQMGAADADFRLAYSIYAKNSWTPLRLSDLTLVPNHLDWQFENGVNVMSYSVDDSLSVGSATTQVVLYWAIQGQMPLSYTVQLQLVTGENKIIGQSRAVPMQGAIPAAEWLAGNVYREIYSVPYTLPAGSTDSVEVRLALLDPLTSNAWPLISSSGAIPKTLATLKIVR
jgi:hypothetical protein